MAELATLARPYSKSAFEYAKAGNALHEWSCVLAFLTEVVTDEKVRAYLATPGQTWNQQADAVISFCEEALDSSAKNFVKLLSQNKRLSLLPMIARQFEHLKAADEGVIEAGIISAVELNDQQKQDFYNALEKKLDQDITLTYHVDPSLIGGAVIRYKDTVIDGSAKNKLERLREALQQ